MSWGLFTTQLLKLKNKLDLVIGSDLFFDPDVFEKLVFTIKWLLSNNQGRFNFIESIINMVKW